jgi:hypothetical protein
LIFSKYLFYFIIEYLEGNFLSVTGLEQVCDADGFGGFYDYIKLVQGLLKHKLTLYVERDVELFESPEHPARKGH